MPATGQAHDPETATGPGIGSVIHMADRTSGGRKRPLTVPEPVPLPAGELSDDPLQRIGEQVQALFMSRGRTLTDRPTADAMRITLDGVIGLINGAFEQGAIGPEEHGMLRAMLEGMRDAPERL